MKSKKLNKNRLFVIAVIVLIILIVIAINAELTGKGLIQKVKDIKERFEIEEIKERIETIILEVEEKEKELGNEITVKSILQELLDNKTFETIDKYNKTGNIEEYEIKLKSNDENKVVVEYVKLLNEERITYELHPSSYTKERNVGIVLEIQGKVKSVTKPDGLIVYPEDEKVAMDYYVTANGEYKFIIEKEDGTIQEKNVIVDIIDILEPKEFEITTNTPGGKKVEITAIAQDKEDDLTSIKSGIDYYEYYIKLATETNYKKYTDSSIEHLKAGKYDIYAVVYDKAGNQKESSIMQFEIERERKYIFNSENENPQFSAATAISYRHCNGTITQNENYIELKAYSHTTRESAWQSSVYTYGTVGCRLENLTYLNDYTDVYAEIEVVNLEVTGYAGIIPYEGSSGNIFLNRYNKNGKDINTAGEIVELHHTITEKNNSIGIGLQLSSAPEGQGNKWVTIRINKIWVE